MSLLWLQTFISSTNPSVIADFQDQSPEKNKRPISNKADPEGQILKNKLMEDSSMTFSSGTGVPVDVDI